MCIRVDLVFVGVFRELVCCDECVCFVSSDVFEDEVVGVICSDKEFIVVRSSLVNRYVWWVNGSVGDGFVECEKVFVIVGGLVDVMRRFNGWS